MPDNARQLTFIWRRKRKTMWIKRHIETVAFKVLETVSAIFKGDVAYKNTLGPLDEITLWNHLSNASFSLSRSLCNCVLSIMCTHKTCVKTTATKKQWPNRKIMITYASIRNNTNEWKTRWHKVRTCVQKHNKKIKIQESQRAIN